jgi:hypothetical protein
MWQSITNENIMSRIVTGQRALFLAVRSHGRACISNVNARRFRRQTVTKGSCMMDRGNGAEDGEASAILIPIHVARREPLDLPVAFERRELEQILRLYGRMVAANEWRDYAIDHMPDRAVFSVFRSTSETPLFQIVKDPKLARRQGVFSVVAAGGSILKRGHELSRVLGVFDRRLKLVEA